MDIEPGLRAHLAERADAPIPADLAARLASRIDARQRPGRRASGRNVILATGSIAAVLVAAFVMFEVVTVAPTHSGPALATGASTPSPRPSPSQSPVPSSTLLAHPTGSRDVILSLTGDDRPAGPIGASFLALHEATTFVLYGDGTAMYGRSPMDFSFRAGGAQFDMFTSKLDPQQVDTVLRFALDTGRLREAHSYPLALIPSSDANLFVDADGVAKGLYVTDPGADDPTLSSPDREIRMALGKLVIYLRTFADSVIARGPEGQSRYRADRYLAVLDDEPSIKLSPPFPGRVVLSPWPWPDVPPSAFRVGSTSARTLVISPDQYDELVALKTAYLTGFAVRGPQGGNYLISVRPLLPGEIPPP